MESQSYEHVFPHAGDDGIVDCDFITCIAATTAVVLVFSERERRRSLYAIARTSVVCRLSVVCKFVLPTLAVQIIGNISTALCTLAIP